MPSTAGISGGGSLNIQPYSGASFNGPVNIAGTYSLQGITIGTSLMSGTHADAISFTPFLSTIGGGGLSIYMGSIYLSPVINTSGGVVLMADNGTLGNISFSTPVGASINANSSIILSASGLVASLTNTSSSPLVSNNSNWYIYESTPALLLNSFWPRSNNVAIWNSNYSSAPPSLILGNSYIFNSPETLTASLSASPTMTYGYSNLAVNAITLTDAYVSSRAYSIAPLSQVFSVLPSLSSGLTAGANVGTYAFSLANTGTPNTGYSVVFSTLTAGTVHVVAKTLTVGPIAETYSGSNVYSGQTLHLQPTESFNSGSPTDGLPFSGNSIALASSVGAITISSANVGASLSTLSSGFALASQSTADYVLSTVAAASVLPKYLTIASATVNPITYSGSSLATLTGSPAVGSEAVGAGNVNDGKIYTNTSVTVGGNAVAAFTSSHAGTSQATVTGLTLTGTGASNYYLGPSTIGSSISPYIVASSLITADITATAGTTKTYNGTNSVSSAFVMANTIVAQGDTLTLGSASALYSGIHAGASMITVSGLAITASSGSTSPVGGDYALATSVVTVAGSIAPVVLIPTLASTGGSKVYDGTTGVPSSVVSLSLGSGVLPGDTLVYSDTLAFSSAHVSAATANSVIATNISLTSLTGSMMGSWLTDYTLASNSATVAASITPYTITPTLSAANTSKTYDGTTSVGTAFTATISGAGLSGDSLSFTDSSAAYNSAQVNTSLVAGATVINVAGVSLSGVTGGSHGSLPSDYVLGVSTASVAASITPFILVPTLSAANTTKIYDGTNSVGSGFVSTLTAAAVAGDTLILSDSAVSYNSAHVTLATNIAATGVSIVSLSTGLANSNLSDYALGSSVATVAANITPKSLALTGLVYSANKTYDGTTVAAVTGQPTLGAAIAVGTGSATDGLPYLGDAVSLAGTAVGGFNSSHAGQVTVVSVSGLTVNSSYTGDYTIVQPTVAGSITPYTITPTLSAANTSKTYDGTSSVGSGFTATLTAAGVGGDTFTMSESAPSYNGYHVVGTSVITGTGISLIGVSGAASPSVTDYVLATNQASVAGNIVPFTIVPTLSGSGVSKPYTARAA